MQSIKEKFNKHGWRGYYKVVDAHDETVQLVVEEYGYGYSDKGTEFENEYEAIEIAKEQGMVAILVKEQILFG